MEQFIIVFLFFLAAIGLMLLSIYFSKYKQKGESCCSGGHCSSINSANNNHECKKENDELMNSINVKKLQI